MARRGNAMMAVALALAGCAVADRAARRITRASKVERPTEACLRQQLEGPGGGH